MSAIGEVQGFGIATLIGAGVNLIAVGGAIWRGAAWTSRVDSERNATAKEIKDIKAVLGNGEPGAVVKRQVCEALHQGVANSLTAIHQDIRSLHDEVRDLHRR